MIGAALGRLAPRPPSPSPSPRRARSPRCPPDDADRGVAAAAPPTATVTADRRRLLVVVAARDEEAVIARAVEPLVAQRRPGDIVLVVADRCTDRTADAGRRSRRRGARAPAGCRAGQGGGDQRRPAGDGRSRLGRAGHGRRRLGRRRRLPRGLRRRPADRRGGRPVAQRGAPRPWRADPRGGRRRRRCRACRCRAGRDRLGVAVRLKGPGMVVRRDVLERAPVPERRQLRGHPLRDGARARRHRARCTATTPRCARRAAAGSRAASGQRLRWEAGRVHLARRYVAPAAAGRHAVVGGGRGAPGDPAAGGRRRPARRRRRCSPPSPAPARWCSSMASSSASSASTSWPPSSPPAPTAGRGPRSRWPRPTSRGRACCRSRALLAPGSRGATVRADRQGLTAGGSGQPAAAGRAAAAAPPAGAGRATPAAPPAARARRGRRARGPRPWRRRYSTALLTTISSRSGVRSPWPPMCVHDGGGRVARAPAEVGGPQAQVGLLGVQEERLVPAVEGVVAAAVDEHRRAARPVDHAGRRVGGGSTTISPSGGDADRLARHRARPRRAPAAPSARGAG